MPDDQPPPGREALPLTEAARRCGLSREALRLRVRRGTVESTKRQGQVYVYLDTLTDPRSASTRTTARTTTRTTATDRPPDPLVEALQGEVAFLRAQLQEKDEQLRRKDVLLQQQGEALRERLALVDHSADQGTAGQPWWRWWRWLRRR